MSLYHRLRGWHKFAGLVSCLFLAVISATGFFLAIKGQVSWMRPDTKTGGEISSLEEVISMDQAAKAAFSVGLAELAEPSHIDRMEYHASDNVFKFLSKSGYHEVQVDGKTAEVLSVGRRNDQMAEDIHDMSYFADGLHKYWLPVIAVLLFTLSISGVIMYSVPIWRRYKFRHLKD